MASTVNSYNHSGVKDAGDVVGGITYTGSSQYISLARDGRGADWNHKRRLVFFKC